MQRIALLMILATVPLLCASMLAQSSDTSADGMMHASLASGNYESAKQCFHGQWFSTSDIAQESSCTMDGFLSSVQPARVVAKQRNTAGRPNAIHSLIAVAHLQPVYEKLADPKLVEYSRSDVAKLYFLRPAGQPLNPPDHQKVGASSEFAREWKQSAKAAENYSAAQVKTAVSFRSVADARTRARMRRPPYYQLEGESENNCLISEEDARPAQQYQGIVADGFARASIKDPIATEKLNASGVETLRSIEFLPIWSEVSGAVIKGMKVKNAVAVR
jgi:hypothetical protein